MALINPELTKSHPNYSLGNQALENKDKNFHWLNRLLRLYSLNNELSSNPAYEHRTTFLYSLPFESTPTLTHK